MQHTFGYETFVKLFANYSQVSTVMSYRRTLIVLMQCVPGCSLAPIIGTGALSANKKTPSERMCYPATAHLKLAFNSFVPLVLSE
jgi:hypothetical protein